MGSVLSWIKSDSHALIILLSVGVLFTYTCMMIFKDKLRVHPLAAFPIAILPTVYGMICVKVFAVAEVSDLSQKGAMSLFGCTFFMPLLFFLLAKLGKRSMADVFDVGTLCMLFTLILARTNCIISGCCKGISFFGMAFHWPTREIEIVFYIVLIIVLWIRTKKGVSNGLNYPIYLMAYGAFRFLIEFVRNNGDHLFHRAHIWAALSFCLGISFYAEINNKLKSKSKTKQKHRR